MAAAYFALMFNKWDRLSLKNNTTVIAGFCAEREHTNRSELNQKNMMKLVKLTWMPEAPITDRGPGSRTTKQTRLLEYQPERQVSSSIRLSQLSIYLCTANAFQRLCLVIVTRKCTSLIALHVDCRAPSVVMVDWRLAMGRMEDYLAGWVAAWLGCRIASRLSLSLQFPPTSPMIGLHQHPPPKAETTSRAQYTKDTSLSRRRPRTARLPTDPVTIDSRSSPLLATAIVSRR